MAIQYIIIDLEATCWPDNNKPESKEIIEIGAVKLDSYSFRIIDEFSSFVRPVENPALSVYCRELTSITQEDVANSSDFKDVFSRFLDWLGPDDFIWCSWGAYDLRQFRIDCARHEVSFPDSFQKHINIKKLFASYRYSKACDMDKAMEDIGLPHHGIHHRGIDDARNTARIARLIFPENYKASQKISNKNGIGNIYWTPPKLCGLKQPVADA